LRFDGDLNVGGHSEVAFGTVDFDARVPVPVDADELSFASGLEPVDAAGLVNHPDALSPDECCGQDHAASPPSRSRAAARSRSTLELRSGRVCARMTRSNASNPEL